MFALRSWTRFGFLLFSLGVTRAHAQEDRDRARTEFQVGVEAYASADYQRALDAFQEAYRLAPHPSVRVNIANCYEQLGRPLEALVHFQHFLSDAENPNPQQRREVTAAIRRLRSRIGELVLQISPDGASVTLDQNERRQAPVTDPVRVTAGEHIVRVELSGYQTEERTLTVAGGSTERVAIRLRRSEAVAAATPPLASETPPAPIEPAFEPTARPTPVPPNSPSLVVAPAVREERDAGYVVSTPSWIAGGVTLAAGIAAAVTGGLALAANADFDRLASTYEASARTDADARDQAEVAADNASGLALASDVLLGVTVAGAITTVVLLVTTRGDSESETSRAALRVSPLVTRENAGLLLAGSF